MRVSIVTISFNQAAYLRELIARVEPVLGPGDEHILVDPGSSDGSRDLIAAYAARDSRVRVLAEPDRGPADGLNKGFALATGDLWAYLNADDLYFPGTLAQVRAFFAAHGDTDVLIGAIKMLDARGKMARRGRVPTRPTRLRFATETMRYVQQGTFFRPEAFRRAGGFNQANRTCWDYELIVDMYLTGARFCASARPLAMFRVHGASITGTGSNSDAYFRDRRRIAEKLRAQGVSPAPSAVRTAMQMESRWNPLRRLAEFWPVLPPT